MVDVSGAGAVVFGAALGAVVGYALFLVILAVAWAIERVRRTRARSAHLDALGAERRIP